MAKIRTKYVDNMAWLHFASVVKLSNQLDIFIVMPFLSNHYGGMKCVAQAAFFAFMTFILNGATTP